MELEPGEEIDIDKEEGMQKGEESRKVKEAESCCGIKWLHMS